MATASQRKQGSPKANVAPAPPAKAPASQDAIAQRAYEIWNQSGRPDGQDQAHWLQAERELRGGAKQR